MKQPVATSEESAGSIDCKGLSSSKQESASDTRSNETVNQAGKSHSPSPSSPAASTGRDFQVGSVVEVIINGKFMHGQIRWLGVTKMYENEGIAGLELEEAIDQGSDGAFFSERYFTCPPGRAFFVKMSCLRPDRRYRSVAPSSSSSQISLAGIYSKAVHRLAKGFRGAMMHLEDPSMTAASDSADSVGDLSSSDVRRLNAPGDFVGTEVGANSQKLVASNDEEIRSRTPAFPMTHCGLQNVPDLLPASQVTVPQLEDDALASKPERNGRMELELALSSLRQTNIISLWQMERVVTENYSRQKEITTLSSRISALENANAQLLQHVEDDRVALEAESNRRMELESRVDSLTLANEVSLREVERLVTENLAKQLDITTLRSGNVALENANAQLLRHVEDDRVALEAESNRRMDLESRVDSLTLANEVFLREIEHLMAKNLTNQLDITTLSSRISALENANAQLLQHVEDDRVALEAEINRRMEFESKVDGLRKTNEVSLREAERLVVENLANQQEVTTLRTQLTELARQLALRKDWILERNEIQLTDGVLGCGAWGSVTIAKFRGTEVAVKQIHQLILSPHNRRLFEREMAIASRCRHPCLLQFIGATNDDGSPLFVTELLGTDLRSVLGRQPLLERECVVIGFDVIRALNYLHLSRPDPIIHRDISSSNILLYRENANWRAKVSDYGAANFVRLSMTCHAGAVLYAAPEASSAEQTPKLDVYSFGILFCELCTRELPVPDCRTEQIQGVLNANYRQLIERCTTQNPSERPTSSDIVTIFDSWSRAPP